MFSDIKSPKLLLVSSNDSKEWKITQFQSNSNLPKNATVSIPSNQRNFEWVWLNKIISNDKLPYNDVFFKNCKWYKHLFFSLIGFVVPEGISDEEICRVADEIYQRLYQVPVQILVKQHAERPSDIYIRCVEKSKSGDAQNEMAKQGYKNGPVEMVELGLRDTEEVIFKANGNIKYLSRVTQMSFFLNIDSAYLSFQIDVLNKEAQSSSRTYQGILAYNVGDTPQTQPRSGSFAIHLPKVRLNSKNYNFLWEP